MACHLVSDGSLGCMPASLGLVHIQYIVAGVQCRFRSQAPCENVGVTERGDGDSDSARDASIILVLSSLCSVR